MPLLVPAVTSPIVPPLSTAAAANARADETAPQSTFGTVLAQAQAGSPQGATSPTALPAPQSDVDTSGTDPNTGETADPTRVAAESAAGLFVVGPGVVLSSTGAPVSGADATGAPAQPPAPPSDAERPTDAVSRAAEFRLREFVAPQALPQTATARLATTPNAPTPPAAAEEIIEANAAPDALPQAGTAAAQALPLPAAAAVPVPATGLPAGQSPRVVPQVPVVSDLVVPPGAAPSVAETAAPPVAEPVAAAPLPGVTVGDRPNTVGDRLAADAADGARLATTRPTQGAEPFAQVLAATAPNQPAATTLPTDPAAVRPAAAPVASAVGDIRASQATAAPAAATATVAAPAPTTPTVTASTPTAPVVVAPRSNVAAPVTAEAVAPPADPSAAATARPTAAGPVAAPLTTTAPVAPNATPLPVTFAEVFRGRAAVDVEPARATTTPADATPDAAAAFVAAAAPPAPTTTPAAPAARAAVAQPAAVQVADGITAHVRTLDRSGETEFRMRLDPPELGRVHVRLLSDGDAVRGQVLVADEAVRQVIESQLPELRQRLEAAGLSVGRFDVSTDPGANGRGNPYQPATADLGAEPAATARPATRPAAPARSGRLDVTV